MLPGSFLFLLVGYLNFYSFVSYLYNQLIYWFVGRKDFGDQGVHSPEDSSPVTVQTRTTTQKDVKYPTGKISNLDVDDLIVIKSSFECKYLIIL